MGRNYYTVLFLDPDCDFVDGSGIRWVRTNVPFDKPNFSGDVVFPYFPQLAQTPTGAFGGDKTGGFIHRCVFLVYRQRGHVDPHVVHNYFKRHPTDFFVGKLVRMVNLEPVATAGNFFYGSFNPVPMLVSEEKKELLSWNKHFTTGFNKWQHLGSKNSKLKGWLERCFSARFVKKKFVADKFQSW